LVFLVCAIPLSVNAVDASDSVPVRSLVSDWRALQKFLDSQGVIVETVNTIDVLTPVSGGIRHNTATAGDLDLLLTIDGEKILGLKSSTFFVYGLGLYGEDPSRNVGDAQTVSSLEAPNTWKLFEAWYQQNFFQERVSMLAGLYDVTSEFDVIRASSELFLNSSFGTGAEFAASGKNGPSTFPSTSLALRGQAILNDSVVVRGVIADGVPGDPDNPDGTQVMLQGKDGLLWGAEFSYYTFPKKRKKGDRKEVLSKRRYRVNFQRVGRAAPMEYEGKYALGVWGYTTELEDASEVDGSGNPIRRDGTFGFYGLGEQQVYRETDDPTQGLTLFARAGWADPRVNRFSQYYGGGAVYRGLFPGRPFDELGIGVAVAVNGSHYEQAQRSAAIPVDHTETAFELAYGINVAEAFLIQPDIQYVMNPGTNPSVANAFVLGIRLGVNFNWFAGSEG